MLGASTRAIFIEAYVLLTLYPPPPPDQHRLQEIIGPLLAALPENDKRKNLQAVYSKAQRAKNGEGESGGGGIGSLFGGWGGKSKTDTAAKPAAPAAPAAAKKGGMRKPTAGGKKAAAAATVDPYAFAAAKLSGKDYELFKTRTTLYARGGINARQV